MTTFKKDFLLLIRSKLTFIIISVFPFLISSWYMGVSNSYIEMLSIIPTYITLTLPLFAGLLSFNSKNILLKKKIISVLLSKVALLSLLYFLILILTIPLLISISQINIVDPGIIAAIFISIILYTFFSAVLVHAVSRIFKGKIISYIVSMFLLLFLSAGKIFTGDLTNSLLEFIKVTPKLGRMYSGVIDIKDVNYFIFIPLILILFIYLRDFSKKRILIIVCSLVVTLLIGFMPIRFDLTSRGSYKINDISLNIISKARVPINLTYYSSANFKQIEEYLSLFNSIDSVNYRKIDHKDPIFDKAVNSFKPIDIEKSGLYSFIVIEYLTRYKVIPIVSVIETLEFELLKEFDFLITGEVDSVGIMIAEDDVDSNNISEDFSVLREVLERDFTVEYLKPGDVISKYLDCLIVIGHKNIAYEELSNIGDYLSDGGSILIAANGVDISNNLNKIETPLLKALNDAGIIIEPFLIGDNDNIGIVDEDGRETPYPLNVITKPGADLVQSPYLSPFPGFNAIYLSPIRSNIEGAIDVLVTSKDSWLVDSNSGLTSNRLGSYSGAVFVETDLWKTFAGKESDVLNRVLVLGNTSSLTNLSYNLGISRGYDFIYRSIYYLLGKEQYLEIRHKFDYHDFNISQNSTLRLRLFHILFYPLLNILIMFLLRRRFR